MLIQVTFRWHWKPHRERVRDQINAVIFFVYPNPSELAPIVYSRRKPHKEGTDENTEVCVSIHVLYA